MKTKHTPGPWTVDDLGGRYIYVRNGKTDVAKVELNEADAALIAAAPEMLDSLTMIAIEADREAKSIGASARRGDQSKAETFRWIRHRALAAIRKAKGEL